MTGRPLSHSACTRSPSRVSCGPNPDCRLFPIRTKIRSGACHRRGGARGEGHEYYCIPHAAAGMEGTIVVEE
ncbi:plastocyanin/azurin family copper-binding protein [Haloarchaeobius sp. HME9146]|uniref:plastocyanin/azurin family copper-binding protein n=1 Tax=Haloarchaeobius sp. HME9146 TaxID=2978732 RepID=UPI0034E97509